MFQGPVSPPSGGKHYNPSLQPFLLPNPRQANRVSCVSESVGIAADVRGPSAPSLLVWLRSSPRGKVELMNSSAFEMDVVTSQMFMQNCYILRAPKSQDCLVVDPGVDIEAILNLLRRKDLRVAAILNTHGHLDHIAGNQAVKEAFPKAPLVIGQGDAFKLTDPAANLSAGYGVEIVSPPADQTVQHGQVLEMAGLKLEVRDTPGHSSGHVVFVLPDAEPIQVIGGDVLFAGSVGRTDFPDGDMQQLVESIHQQLFTLPDDTVVWPGHGPATTVGEERRSNPFCALG